jgi:hypothetical protein
MPIIGEDGQRNPFSMGYGGGEGYGSNMPQRGQSNMFGGSGGGGKGGYGGFGGRGAALATLISGLIGGSGSPYDAAADKYRQRSKEAQDVERPFYNEGRRSLGDYRGYLDRMKDPEAFINKLMGDYSMSPYAQNLQKQAMRGATNAASASGLVGSTPFMNASAKASGDIASQDQERWLQDVLGVNKEYGSGLQFSIGSGQNSANSIAKLLEELGIQEGQAAYGSAAGDQLDWNNILSGGLSFLFG